MKEKLLCVIIELIGIIVISAGIGIELAYKADIGYVTMSAGAIMITAGSVVYAKTDWRK